ncbi:hypothetical protein THAR02_10917 [Trichoderma harzianum]|uniref:Major facilitator superfamily (MFS) profile domain-containing protein n=1 Tax=Trichoderma harzianum TaxID=5544 RepID=A0A0F9X853_TRIHA|nr:hypothetical protein THAR02_10917 [Trichoderma harzianum]
MPHHCASVFLRDLNESIGLVSEHNQNSLTVLAFELFVFIVATMGEVAAQQIYDTGTISGILAMPYWQTLFSSGYYNPSGHLDVNPSESSAIVSILSAGNFFGSLSSPALGDIIGRRLALIVSSFVFIFGVVLQTAATGVPLFLAGCFFAGFGSETAPKWIRGAIDTGLYRIPIAVQFAWALILIGGMLFLPETPRYLLKRGRDADAAKSLAKFRRLTIDHPSVVEELAEICANHEYELSIGTATYLDCFRGTMLKRQLTGMGL